MMGTYLMMLYVSLEQEVAVKQLFTTKGWGYNKPDLRMMTGDIGPLMEETMQTKVVTNAPSQDILQTQPVLQSQEFVLTQTSEQVSRQVNQIMEQSNYCHEMPLAQALSDIPKQQDQQSAEEAKRPKRTPKRNPKYFEKTEVDTKSAKKTSKPRTVKSHPKVEVDTDKSNKSMQENAEFQEILQEAEIIAASLSNIETENYEDHKTPVSENETDSVETGQFQVKIEQYADDDDITDFDTQVNDNTVENTETDNVPSCSNETEEVSAGPSGSRTSSAKKRKMTGKIVASQGETKMELASYSSTNITSTDLTSADLTSTDIASTDLTRPNRSNKAYKLEKKAELMYICQACGYKSNQKSNLLRHERIQHGNEHFDCPRCNKKYRSPATLKSHLLSHDSPEICESCGKKFSSKAGLKFHINKVHLSFANFECPICKKLFQTSTDFDGHMNAHKGYKPYSCPTCIKSFSYRSSLTSHMKHCSRAASHSCKSCDSVFKTETLLAQHMLGKHGEQVFTCACGKCFKWKTSMHRHQNTCPVSVSSPD